MNLSRINHFTWQASGSLLSRWSISSLFSRWTWETRTAFWTGISSCTGASRQTVLTVQTAVTLTTLRSRVACAWDWTLMEKQRNLMSQCWKDIMTEQRCTVNSLWPSDIIWCHKSTSTSVQVNVSPRAPSYYLNQCWLIVKWILRNKSVKFPICLPLGLCKATASGLWKMMAISTCHMNPQSIMTEVFLNYRKVSNIRHTKSPNWNDSHLVLKSSLPNPLKPGENYIWVIDNSIAH